MPNKPKSEAQGIQLSYRYRIYPTPEQEKALAFEFDACRYVYNHFLRARTESWERTQKTLRRPKLAPGADPNARHPEYVKDPNGKTVWEEYVNESYDPEAKAMGRIPSKILTALKDSCLDEDGNLWLKQADSSALGYSTMNLDKTHRIAQMLCRHDFERVGHTHDLERTIWFCRKCGLEISCDAPRRNGAEGKCEKCGRLLSKHENRCPDHPHAAVRTLGKRR